MPTEKSDLLQGTLDMLILKIVALGPVHGYGIAFAKSLRKFFKSSKARSTPPSIDSKSAAGSKRIGANLKKADKRSSIVCQQRAASSWKAKSRTGTVSPPR